MTNKIAIWRGHGWKRPEIGTVRIKKGVKPYGGKRVPLIDQYDNKVIVWIEPTERTYRRDEVEDIDT